MPNAPVLSDILKPPDIKNRLYEIGFRGFGQRIIYTGLLSSRIL